MAFNNVENLRVQICSLNKRVNNAKKMGTNFFAFQVSKKRIHLSDYLTLF